MEPYKIILDMHFSMHAKSINCPSINQEAPTSALSQFHQ